MKKFFRRVNRGLLLAAVLIIGVVIYVLADNGHFKASIPDIEKAAGDYLAKVKEINLMPAEQKAEQTLNMLEQYWCDKENTYYVYGFNKTDMKNYLETVKKYHSEKTNLTQYNEIIRDMEVAKNGPGCAKVTVSYDVSMMMDKQDTDYQIFGLEADTYGGYYNVQGENELVCSQNLLLTLYFYETDGMWKIGSIDAVADK